MSNTIVMYQSKYGATQKYAQWLSEELNCDLVETKHAKIDSIMKYETIILGGGIYAMGIAGLSFIKKNQEELKDKNIVLFAVGASPYEEKSVNEIKQHNLKNINYDIPFYYLRGSWHESKMTLKDRTLCKMLKKMVSKKDPSEYEVWEQALIEAIGSDFDWTEKENIKPIIEFVENK